MQTSSETLLCEYLRRVRHTHPVNNTTPTHTPLHVVRLVREGHHPHPQMRGRPHLSPPPTLNKGPPSLVIYIHPQMRDKTRGFQAPSSTYTVFPKHQTATNSQLIPSLTSNYHRVVYYGEFTPRATNSQQPQASQHSSIYRDYATHRHRTRLTFSRGS